jgi:hypothetical protein
LAFSAFGKFREVLALGVQLLVRGAGGLELGVEIIDRLRSSPQQELQAIDKLRLALQVVLEPDDLGAQLIAFAFDWLEGAGVQSPGHRRKLAQFFAIPRDVASGFC